jgi:Fic family protein
MRIPSSPPDIGALVSKLEPEALLSWWKRCDDPEIAEFIRRCNDSYLHWDKIRYYKHLPHGLSLELLWAAISMSRRQQHQRLPITFNDSQFVYWNTSQHLEWLCKIDQNAGGSLGSASQHPIPHDDERYLINSLMEEAIASSLLEGAVTTRKLAKQMLLEGRKPASKAETMIVNNYNAILRIRDLKYNKLTPELLKELHSILTENTLDNPSAEGRFRGIEDNVIVEDTRTHETLFTPPSATQIESYIDEICSFANERSKHFIHPVIKAIILHFALGFVHPFEDGNGRTARAIFYWYMLKRGYWLFEYLPISRIFLNAPAKYARSYLYTETDNGDVTYFIHYNLEVIIHAIKSLHAYLREQQWKISQAAEMLKDNPELNHRQQNLIYYSLKNPQSTISVLQHKRTHNISYGTARTDLLSLASMGYLKQTKRQKKLIFYPDDRLLSKLKAPSFYGDSSRQLLSGSDTVPDSIAVTRNRRKKTRLIQHSLFRDDDE